MGKPQRVLALGFGEEFDSLAGRLLLLNFRATRASSTEDALPALERSTEPIRAVLLSVPHSLDDLGLALGRLREHAPSDFLRFVATGPEPSPREREELREAGVEFGLWKPFEDAALRFVLNEALQDASIAEARRAPRAPTTLLARVFSSVGQKAALVYSLSERGGFLETLRPTSTTGHVRVEIPLPSGTVTVEARVVVTNVPGNLHKPNLPMGMGVEFTDVPEETRCALAEYVDSLIQHFRLDQPDPE